MSRERFLREGYIVYRNRSLAADDHFILDYDLLKACGRDHAILCHVERYWRQLFFEKSLDWSSEGEYRFLFWAHEQGTHIFPFGEALKGIALGSCFPSDRLIELAPYQPIVPIVQLNWQFGSPHACPIPGCNEAAQEALKAI